MEASTGAAHAQFILLGYRAAQECSVNSARQLVPSSTAGLCPRHTLRWEVCCMGEALSSCLDKQHGSLEALHRCMRASNAGPNCKGHEELTEVCMQDANDPD